MYRYDFFYRTRCEDNMPCCYIADLDFHKAALERLCRVCGQRCVKYPASLKNHKGLCKIKHKEKLKETYNINVENDCEEIHPKYICLSCYAACDKKTHRPVVGWTEHTAVPCMACSLMRNTVGKRKRKPAAVGVERRLQRIAAEKQQETVDKACEVVLGHIKTKSPSRKIQRIATEVVKSLMDDDELIELPTGGSVSIIYSYFFITVFCLFIFFFYLFYYYFFLTQMIFFLFFLLYEEKTNKELPFPQRICWASFIEIPEELYIILLKGSRRVVRGVISMNSIELLQIKVSYTLLF